MVRARYWHQMWSIPKWLSFPFFLSFFFFPLLVYLCASAKVRPNKIKASSLRVSVAHSLREYKSPWQVRHGRRKRRWLVTWQWGSGEKRDELCHSVYFISILGPQAFRWYNPHSRWVFCSHPNLSGNRDMSKGVSPGLLCDFSCGNIKGTLDASSMWL